MSTEYIHYGHQEITEDDIAAVESVLRSEYLTQGPCIPRFEQSIADYCHAKYAVAVTNATAALHIACKALHVEAGDRVWTSPNTFLASANCAIYCGATVDFVDIDPKTYNMSADKLAEKLQQAAQSNTLPKAIIVVHFAGQSCDMQKIKQLADQYGIRIIADASHAIGGRYLGEPIGCCKFADIAVFSFHPVKIITSGEGGVATTNDTELANRMRELRTHGVTRDPARMQNPINEPWYYEQVELGYNYRITDMQAALGNSQLQRIDEYIRRRHCIARMYHNALSKLPLQLPYQDPNGYSAFHLYPILLRTDTVSRAEVFARLREANIGVNVHYIPLYRQPYYQQFDFDIDEFPVTENYYAHEISLPMFPTLTNDQQQYVIDQLKKVLQ